MKWPYIWISILLTALTFALAPAQVKIIEDRFHFRQTSFDITLANTGPDTVTIDSICVNYDWFKLQSNMPSAGSGLVIKPSARILVKIPKRGFGKVGADLEHPLVVLPYERVRLEVGLSIDLGNKRIGLDVFDLKSSLSFVFEKQDALNSLTWIIEDPLFENLRSISDTRNYSAPVYKSYPYQDLLLALKALSEGADTLQLDFPYPNLLDKLTWSYVDYFALDSLMPIYDLALGCPQVDVRIRALDNIRKLNLSRYSQTVKQLLRKVETLREARACAKALHAFNQDYTDLLIEKLKIPDASVDIVGFCINELGKLGHVESASLVIQQLSNPTIPTYAYEKIRLTFQLMADSSYNQQVYTLLEDKQAWAYADEDSIHDKFSQLLLLALYNPDTALFLPLIKKILDNGEVHHSTLETFLFHSDIIVYLYAASNVRKPRSWGYYFSQRIGYPKKLDSEWHKRKPAEGNITFYFAFDNRFHRKPFSYPVPKIDWVKELWGSLIPYMNSSSPKNRISLLSAMDRIAADKTLLDPILRIAIQDSVSG